MKTEDVGSRGKERRRAPRYRYQASLEIEWGSARLKAALATSVLAECSLNRRTCSGSARVFGRASLRIDALWLDCSVKRVEPGLRHGRHHRPS